jgi:4-hydroxybenzoate polyprenyltransferase
LTALWRLARPRGGAVLLLVPLLGYGIALWDHALDPVHPLELLAVLTGWFVASAGTMWLNASLDGDENEALFARPTQRPRGLAWYGYGALGAGVILVLLANRVSGAFAAACAVLSVLYSHPRTMWKARPVLGPLVNGLGYGVLTSLGGWAIVGVPLSVRVAAAFASVTVFIVGTTFAAQAFQRDDDARRGYRTLVVTHGPAACLRAARACAWASIAIVAVGCAAGFYPRICLLGLPTFGLVDRWVRAWQSRGDGGTPSHAAGFVARMLATGVVLLGLAYVDFLRDRAAGGPIAGLATARGKP